MKKLSGSANLGNLFGGTALLFCTLATLAFTGCSSGGDRLSLTIKGLPEDSMICSYISPAMIEAREQMGNVMVGPDSKGGQKYSFPFPDGKQVYKVYLAPRDYKGDGPQQNIELFVMPGQKVHIDAVYDAQSKMIDYTIEGSPEQQEILEQEAKNENLKRRLEMLNVAYMSTRNPLMRDSIGRFVKTVYDSLTGRRVAYIVANRDRETAGLCLTMVEEPRLVDSLYGLLSPQVKNGAMKGWLDMQSKLCRQQTEAQRARESVVVGNRAPDFTLPTVEGKEFTLSSLYGKGKFVVVDFWGTWCAWCIKGMPQMKEAYAKYGPSGRVEFVSVDCNDKQEVWRKAVQEYGMSWVNVRAEDDQVGVQYGLEVFPTKLILSPEGLVVGRYAGETPAFYEKLAELLK